MKKNISILVIAAVLFVANTALAGTSFYYGQITFDVVHEGDGTSALRQMVTVRKTTKTTRNWCNAIGNSVKYCQTYEVGTMIPKDEDGRNLHDLPGGNYLLVAHNVVGAIKKSGTARYQYYSSTARFNKTQPGEDTYWKRDDNEPSGTYMAKGTYRSGSNRIHYTNTYYYGPDTEQYLSPGVVTPLLQTKYQYTSNDSISGREFHFSRRY